ncbi:hypothetical protein KAR26_02630 [Candidatus Parcubacteria bacterium]|nr:hypothetical protein [Candidatus Parcubacteria bacterium]
MAEEIIKILEEYKEETKRHFDVVAEDLKGEIKAVAEQVAGNTEKLEVHDQKFDKIGKDIGIIKLDIEFIKNELKQKVALDEFAALERRVSMLEAEPK